MIMLHVAMSREGSPPDLTSIINARQPEGLDVYGILADAVTDHVAELGDGDGALERLAAQLNAMRGHVPEAG